jgi:sulfate adenylyltransferase
MTGDDETTAGGSREGSSPDAPGPRFQRPGTDAPSAEPQRPSDEPQRASADTLDGPADPLDGPAGDGADEDDETVDLASLATHPHRLLDADGLDLLELALGGGLPATAGRPWRPGEVLTDAENTPLAVVTDAGDLRALRPFAEATGPQWAPEHRIPAAAVRERDRELWTALVVDAVPTRGDQQRLEGRAAAGERIRLLVLSSRTDPLAAPGAAAVAGAWMVVTALARVELVVVPWPAAASLDPVVVAAAYGASTAVVLAWERSPEEAARLAALDTVLEREIQALYPPIAARAILRVRRTDRARGAVVFFTGLSGSGKSTIAKALAAAIEAEDARTVTLLDGDEVRHHLSRGLGFDAESRAINIDRIAYVASLVARHGGIAVAAPIAPFEAGRRSARAMAEAQGAVFLLVHVSTSLEVCEARDRKGLYAKARAGQVPEFTGISSPYEVPADADLTIDTVTTSVESAVDLVRRMLAQRLEG